MPRQHIIVVDADRPFDGEMAERLEGEGYAVTVVDDPEDIYHAVKEQPPDLLIVDLNLTNPETSWSTLDILRVDPTTKEVPAIATSTDEKFLRDKLATLRRRRTALLAKPFGLDELIQRIRMLIGPAT